MRVTFKLKNNKVVSTRSFKRGDFESLVSFFKNLSRESMPFGIPHYYDRTRLSKLTSDLERDIILLALNGNRIVGVAGIFGSPLLQDRGIGEFVVYIHQDYQNQGLGTYLTKSILEEAKRRDFHKVSLQVVAENVAGIKAYKKAGFGVEGRKRDSHFGDDGTYHDLLIMGIIL